MPQKTSSSSESPMPPPAASRSDELPPNDRRSLQRRLRVLPILLTLIVAVLGGVVQMRVTREAGLTLAERMMAR
jgi:hypothetical protein